jgi:hypothetical protein
MYHSDVHGATGTNACLRIMTLLSVWPAVAGSMNAFMLNSASDHTDVRGATGTNACLRITL